MPDDHATVRVSIADLEPGHTRLFPFERDGIRLSAFVLNHQGDYRVYVNRCAHVTYSLDIGDGQIMDAKREFILCSSHGARYLPESGECFMGPAVGRSLEALPFDRTGDEIVVNITDEPPGWPGTPRG